MIHLLGFALGGLSRRRRKSLAIGGGLAFAVALLGAVLFLTDALRADASRARLAMPDIVVAKMVGGRPTTIDEGTAHAIENIDSVASVTPRVWGYIFLPALQGNVTIVGVKPGQPTLDGVKGAIARGHDMHAGAHEMILGDDLAKFLGLGIGDQLGLPTPDPTARPLKLVGTFGSAIDLYTADVLLCDEDDARRVLAMPQGQATDLAVRLHNPDEAHVVARTITDRLPGVRVIDRDLLARVYELAYGRRAGIVLAASIPVLFALFVLAWDRVSGLSPEEKREIAILKAVGFSTKDVLWIKLFESLLIASFATALGLAVAYAWVFLFGAPGLRPALVGWSVLYPEAPLTPAVDFAELLGISLAVIGPFVLLGVVPAWRAAVIDPVESMRG